MAKNESITVLNTIVVVDERPKAKYTDDYAVEAMI